VQRGNGCHRLASLKLRHQHLFFLRGPGSTDVSRQLRTPLRTGGHLFEGSDASQ